MSNDMFPDMYFNKREEAVDFIKRCSEFLEGDWGICFMISDREDPELDVLDIKERFGHHQERFVMISWLDKEPRNRPEKV